MGQTLAFFPFHPGGNFVAFNLTAATVIKSSPGVLYRVAILTAGTTGGALTFNDANANIAGQTITGITQAAQAVITYSAASQQFTVGNNVIVSGAVGMTQINNLVYVPGTVNTPVQAVAVGTVSAGSSYSVTINVNSTAFTAWASGGTAGSAAQGNELWTLPFGSSANVAGNTLVLEFPCVNGILLSAVPTAGSPLTTVSYA